MLIDTGADESYLDPILIKPVKTITIKTISNALQVDKIIILNGLKELRTTEKLKFHLLKFHNIFDGLIGTNILKQLGIIIDIRNKTLTLPTHSIQMKSFKVGSNSINLTQNLPKTQLEEIFHKYQNLFESSMTRIKT